MEPIDGASGSLGGGASCNGCVCVTDVVVEGVEVVHGELDMVSVVLAPKLSVRLCRGLSRCTSSLPSKDEESASAASSRESAQEAFLTI